MRKKFSAKEDFAGQFERQDIEKARVSAALAYLAFFIPLIICPECRFGKFHAGQSLLLLVLSTIGINLLILVPYAGIVLGILLALYCVVFAVRGFVDALRRKARRIPVLGRFNLISSLPRDENAAGNG